MKKSLIFAIAFMLTFVGLAYSADRPAPKPEIVKNEAEGKMDWKTVRRDVTFGEGVKLIRPKWLGLRFGVKKDGQEQVTWFCLDADADNMPTQIYLDANGDFVLDADEKHEVTKQRHGAVMANFEIEIAGHKEKINYYAFADKRRRKLEVTQDGDRKTRVIIGWDPRNRKPMQLASSPKEADIFSLRQGLKHIVFLQGAYMSTNGRNRLQFCIVSQGSGESVLSMMDMKYLDLSSEKFPLEIDYPTTGGVRKKVSTKITGFC